MVKKKDDVDFYCGFSRKELQSLCKKYNLPANRSRSDMAVSLSSYFQKRSLNPLVFGNQDSLATSSRTPTSRKSDLKRAREHCFQGAGTREPTSNKPYQERNGNGGFIDCSSEKDPKSDSKKVVKSRLDSRLEVDNGDSPSSSSFEFHVSLEEGISLSVDLNFNPSDWINSMRDEVNVYDSLRRSKSPNNATESKKQKSSLQDKDEDTRRDNTQLPCSRIKESSNTLSIPDFVGPSEIVSSVLFAAEQNHLPSDHLLTEIPSMDSFQKVRNSSTGLSTSEADRESSRFSTLSSPEELIINRESITYSELFKFQ